ncbi:channel protein TolC [Pseudomonas sp. TTU2014-096BSC]|nr:channel protein TolC [Pseudomonas sp. TTU2014-096BSC]
MRYFVARVGLMALVLVSLVGHAHSPEGQSSTRASLLSVYTQAAINDAELAAARHEYRARTEAAPQARSGLLPSITAGLVSESTRLDRDKPELTRSRSGTTLRASLTQPLFRLDRWFELKAAQADVAQAEMELAAKEQALILRVAEAYFETLRQLDALAASRAEESALLEQQAQAQGRLEGGAASITDVLDAQAAYDLATANSKVFQRNVDEAFDVLFRLTARDYIYIDGVDHSMPVNPPFPNDAAVWVDSATKQNLNLIAANHAVTFSEEKVRQSRAGFSPTVDVVASYRKGDNDSFGYNNPSDFGRSDYRDDVVQSSIGIELSIPIYSGGMTRSQVRQSVELLAKSEDDRENARREVVFLTRSSHRAINAGVEQIAARLQAIKSGRMSLEANKVGLRVGTRNMADVLNAQRQLYAAVRDYNNFRYDYIIDNFKLKQATGMLGVGDLEEFSSYLRPDYDPDRDFLPAVGSDVNQL